ncbi:MAG: ATP-binding cassette domain-containing protein [Desulfatiglans sp.]|jgi:branched-chain amino acid transport system ATP-binding protein|nr:ATP-binding cassette domain-containing protein [Desulfatiglans sp.]
MLLKANNLMVFFENALAVNNVSFAVDEGEIVGILGSNGAGKSTLMNTISGLILDMKLKEEMSGGERIIVAGELEYRGEEILDIAPDKRIKKGIVLARERHPIFTEITALENLKVGGYLRRKSEAKKTLEYVFRLFPHLKLLKGREAGFLSGGEQQMLSIGMALMAQPSLLLLDEPLLGLAPAIQESFVQAIKKISDDTGISILIAEQFARPLMPLLRRGYVIENGTLVFSGTRKELIDNPEVEAAYFGI